MIRVINYKLFHLIKDVKIEERSQTPMSENKIVNKVEARTTRYILGGLFKYTLSLQIFENVVDISNQPQQNKPPKENSKNKNKNVSKKRTNMAKGSN